MAGGTITRELFRFPGDRRFHFLDFGGNEIAAYPIEPEDVDPEQ